MKKIITLILVLALCLTCFAGCGEKAPEATDTPATEAPAAEMNSLEKIKAAGKLVVSTSPDYAPYEFIDYTKPLDEQVVGSDMQIAQYIADYIGVELEIQAMDFDSCQAAVYTGKVDMSVSGFAYTEERANNANLSDPYRYGSTKQGIIVPADKASEYKTAADYDGKTIAAQNGSLQYTMVTEQLPGATVEVVTDLNNALMMLLSGKIDGFATSDDVGEVQIAANPSVAFGDFWFEYADDGNVILMQKGADELTAAVNEALIKAAEENLFVKWLEEADALQEELGL